MKQRYRLLIHVDAESVGDALKEAKKVAPQEVFLDDKVWEKRNYALTEETSVTGFVDKK